MNTVRCYPQTTDQNIPLTTQMADIYLETIPQRHFQSQPHRQLENHEH